MPRDFRLQVFLWISFPQAPEYTIKFEITLMLFSGAWGKMIHGKNLKQKISRHCPFNWKWFFPQQAEILEKCQTLRFALKSLCNFLFVDFTTSLYTLNSMFWQWDHEFSYIYVFIRNHEFVLYMYLSGITSRGTRRLASTLRLRPIILKIIR